MSFPTETESVPRVVIIGAGFGGVAAAQALKGAPVAVTLIDRRNHHLFQPLLYQVATAALAPNDIATPIRGIFRRQQNVSVLLGEVHAIDAARREVRVGNKSVPFDHLVIATGARHAYFGRDEWERFAPGLKTLEDAFEIRRRVLEAFELAEAEDDPVERHALLNFVIIGGGPAGVEMSGAIAELAKRSLVKDFRKIDAQEPHVTLVEAGPGILRGFDDRLSRAAERALVRLGVEVRVGNAVTHCDAGGVVVAGERLFARTIIWAAGVGASPAAEWLHAEADRAGRVMVGPDLSLRDHREIFVIGDVAHVPGCDGTPLPGTAAVAKQQGRYVARLLDARARGRPTPAPFRYRHYGSLATIGRKSAVADLGRVRMSGSPAWVLWSLAHIFFLVGWGNRLAVLANWAWAYVRYDPRARLIIGTRPYSPPIALPTPGKAMSKPASAGS